MKLHAVPIKYMENIDMIITYRKYDIYSSRRDDG